MKKFSVIIGLSILLIVPVTIADPAPDAQIKAFRGSIKAMGMNLKKELQAGMKAGGPVNALDVCHTQAMPITNSHSDKVDWTLSRTSLKPRNENNAPDAWETKVMLAFEARKAKGEEAKKLDFSEIVVAEDGKKSLRYMKAIPTGGVCLACHGETLAPEVSAKLKTLYPNDQAVGFKIGDLRGAFSISQDLH